VILSFIYNGSHSIHFIEALDSSTNSTPTAYTTKVNSWNDLHLIPLTRPSVVAPSPSIKIIDVPGSSNRIDLTDLQPGGLKYGIRSGSWKFAIDHDRYIDWHTAKKTIENALNGKRLYCVLDDDLSSAYRGRFSVDSWETGVTYSSVTIKYQLESKRYTNAFNIISSDTEIQMINSWAEVDDAIRDGSYTTKFHVGDSIFITIGGEYSGYAKLAGMNVDIDSNGHAIPMTWILNNQLNTSKEMVSSGIINYRSYGTSPLSTYVDDLINSVPSRVKAMIVPTFKTFKESNYDGSTYTDGHRYKQLWIPSYREVFGEDGSSNYESSGPIYSSIFPSGYVSKIRRKLNDTGGWWWLRSIYSGNTAYYSCVTSTGTTGASGVSNSNGIILGFCTGAST
jgi:hypothetical protein